MPENKPTAGRVKIECAVPDFTVAGMARYVVPARAERVEYTRYNVRPSSIAPLDAARTAQRAVPTPNTFSFFLFPFAL
jgi:hypothetical protein